MFNGANNDSVDGFGDNAEPMTGETSSVDADMRFVSPTQRASLILRQVNELLDGLPAGLADVEALDSGVFEQARKVADRAQAVLAMAAANVDASGAWSADGSRCCEGFLARSQQLSFSRAKALCHTGRLLRDVLPATSECLQRGTLGWDIGVDMARHATTSQERREALKDLVEADAGDDAGPDENHRVTLVRAEEWLLAQSRRMSEKQFRVLLKHWAHRVDPEADERGFRRVADREHVVLVETMDCFHLEGVLTIEHGKVLQTALKAIIGVPRMSDARSGAQRMAHALVDLARVNLEQHLAATTSGARPHLTVTVPYATLRTLAEHAGNDSYESYDSNASNASNDSKRIDQLDALLGAEPGTWSDDHGPIPNSLLARLACDSTIARVVFGPSGEVINAGRTRRTISSAARTAVIARDKHCVYPRCDAPPGLSEIHHVNHWSSGGTSDLDNLALICWHHHQWTHQRRIAITRKPRENGASQWAFSTPEGHTIE